MESFTENMKTLGTIFGKEAEVDAELGNINGSCFGILHDVFGLTGG